MPVETPTTDLPNDVRMPVVGLGTAGLLGEPGYHAIRAALDAGYRHLDTAAGYHNEAEVGRAVRDSGLDRAEVFVTTKLPPEDAGRAAAVLDESLGRLELDHVDLWLVHWPPAPSDVLPAWEAFRAARDSGRVRAIGVSNYDLGLIDRLIDAFDEPPAVNQIPWSPPRHDPELLAAHRARGVVLEGYSPLLGTDLTAPALAAIADGHGVTPAQVVLRWHLQRGIVVIPKSANPERIRSNLDLWGFELTDEELGVIDGLS
jgi:diketogulonate reductase-like aldo/keto reductase